MKIVVGSKNQVKVEAVRELIADYPTLIGSAVEGVDVESCVRHQPMTLEETIRGSRHRALQAFEHGDLGIGIEGGLTPVPYTKSTYMNISACAIFDGKEYHIGLTSGFESPKSVMRCIIDKGLDMSDAYREAGLTTSAHLGSREGAIGMLTGGRVDRKAYIKEALRCALIHIENAHLFVESKTP